jgi:hypothetical protein
MRTISEALVARITGDAATMAIASGPWLDVAPTPEESPRPVITYVPRASPLDADMCRGNVVRRFSYLLAVEGEQDDEANVRAAAAALEDLLHMPTGWTPTGWHVSSSRFLDVIERAYTDGDYRAFAIIGTLEIVAQRTS